MDFSDAGKAVARFLANRNRRLFSMSTENALITLLREGVTVQESSVDSKRDLEDALRTACNDFIDHTCKSIVDDLMQFAEKAKEKPANVTPKAVQKVLSKTTEGLDESLGIIREQMSLYLENQATQSILLKPVSKKIMRIVEDTKKAIQAATDGWDEDSKAEAIATLESIEQKVKASSKPPAAK